MGPPRIEVLAFSADQGIDVYPRVHAPSTTVRLQLAGSLSTAEVTYVDSTFLMELLLFIRRFNERGAAMVLVSTPNITRVLTLVGFNLRIEIVGTRREAVAFLNQPAAAYEIPNDEEDESGEPATL